MHAAKPTICHPMDVIMGLPVSLVEHHAAHPLPGVREGENPETRKAGDNGSSSPRVATRGLADAAGLDLTKPSLRT
jgi:hypothetical protein